jgi:hypothetical protein
MKNWATNAAVHSHLNENIVETSPDNWTQYLLILSHNLSDHYANAAPGSRVMTHFHAVAH